MNKTSRFPNKNKPTKDADVIKITKEKIFINEQECEVMDLEEFLENMHISREAEEKFVRGLFEAIKSEIGSNFQLMKIFREVFRK